MRVWTLRNTNGVEVDVMDFGGTITSIRVPDRYGHVDDVVLGFDSLDAYRSNTAYFGALVGRYAGRIAYGSFKLDETLVRLTQNHGEHHLHGGARGFHAIQWQVEANTDGTALRLFGESVDGEEGYPGTLTITVRYSLSDDNALTLDYRATTDRPTAVNLTNHSYFNLGGHASGSVLEHRLWVDADQFLRTESDGIPDGSLLPTAGSPVDFRSSPKLCDVVDEGMPDHTLVVNRAIPREPRHVARLTHEPSGRALDVLTTEPGVQVFIPPTLAHLSELKDGARYETAPAICLETQHFPNAPNEPRFPETRLDPDEVYASRTVYRFSIRT